MAITHPEFLLGLLGVVIPVLIHLFELRRPKRLAFTNVSFIREIRIVTARERRVKQWLILLARIGFVIFLVLLFAQPYLPAKLANAPQAEVAHVIVDVSPSMQAGDANDLSRLDQALMQARELPSAYPAGERFALNVHASTSLPANTYKEAIDKLAVSGQGVSVSGLLSRVINTSADEAKQLFVFSDFQKNDFSAQKLHAIDTTTQVFLVPLSEGASNNVFIDSIWMDDAFVRRNSDLVLHVRLQNGGTQPVENCQVRLFVGERHATSFTASVGQAPVTVTARVRLASKQPQLCRVELEDYPVTFDNVFYFAMQASPSVRVLEVSEAAQPLLERVYGNEPLFAYSHNEAGRLDYKQLDKADLVLVRDVARVQKPLGESLRRVLQRGGSVVVVPPAVASGRATYDVLFRELGIGVVQWEAPSARLALREVAVPDRRNPFFRDVFGPQSRQPVMPKAAPVLRWARSGTDIMHMQDGDGFLAAFNSGKGKVYLFSTPLDAASTDFTQHALFVPVLYRLAMQSYRQEQQLAYRLNQRTVVVNVAAEQAGLNEQIFKLIKDSLSFIPEQRLQAGSLRFEVPPGMRLPGFYQLVRGNTPIATLAFNNDKRESELAGYSAEELRRLIGPGRPNIQVLEAKKGTSVAARYKAERVGTPLWQYCVYGALACLLAEVLLLRFRSRPKAQAPTLTAA